MSFVEGCPCKHTLSEAANLNLEVTRNFLQTLEKLPDIHAILAYNSLFYLVNELLAMEHNPTEQQVVHVPN